MPKDATEQDSIKATEGDKEAEDEVKVEPVECTAEAPAAEPMDDGETEETKLINDEKKPKKSTKKKMMSSLSFLKKKSPKKKVSTTEQTKDNDE